MIYELAIVADSDLGAEANKRFGTIVKEVLAQTGGKLLIEDDWGEKRFAQQTSAGKSKGYYLYFMYQSNAEQNNAEIERRLSITEGLLKFAVFKIGLDRDADNLVKNFKTPFSKKYRGSVVDTIEETYDMEDGSDQGTSKKRFAKKRNCWFIANKITADWKDPQTYAWLVSEFGKISPARVSGISRKHQRFATSAVKRARQLGVVSYMTSRILE